MFRIRKNDTVKIISGNDKGKTGKVLALFPRNERVIVEGVNFIKRHTKPTQNNPQGAIIEKEAPLHVSNVKLIHNNEETKVGYRFLNDGRKVRYSKKTGEVIESE